MFFEQIPAINPIYHVHLVCVLTNFPSVLILNTGESELQEKIYKEM